MSSEANHKFGRSLLENLIAGGLARGTSLSILHPMDVIKTRMQYQRKPLEEKVSNVHTPKFKTLYKNSFHALISTVKDEGIRALYKGLLVRWLCIIPSAAINFTIYEQTKTAIFAKEFYKVPLAFVFGALSRAFATWFRTPFDIIKQYQQVNGMQGEQKTKLRIMEIYRDVKAKNGGYRGLFHGFHSTISRDLIFSGAYFFFVRGF